MARVWARRIAAKRKGTKKHEEIKEWHKLYMRKLRTEISDEYVIQKIKRSVGVPLDKLEIPPEFIEIKRKQLKSCRTLKELNNSLKNP